ncbi:MAG TPA: nucleoside hydrolase [Mesorhizobium sp.]|nr:nucleoside hydrolase [Mesorhizobium sp.]
MPEMRKIIIDTDPGQDDAVAILLALGSPELEVVGIAAVAGNVPLALTEKNARKICELAGRPQVKVFAGAVRPLARPLVTAEHVHGRTGLDGPVLPEPVMQLQEQHGVDFIVETLMREAPGSVTICSLGPLTNVALALIREPRIAPRIREIVLMGGGFFEGGNTTPAAEFNIYVDPHAADVVFRSGVPIVMMPLDVTHKALTTAARIEALRELGTRVGTAVAEMLEWGGCSLWVSTAAGNLPCSRKGQPEAAADEECAADPRQQLHPAGRQRPGRARKTAALRSPRRPPHRTSREASPRSARRRAALPCRREAGRSAACPWAGRRHRSRPAR